MWTGTRLKIVAAEIHPPGIRMKLLAQCCALLLSTCLVANALELADVAGSYALDSAETRKHLEEEIATLAKAGKPTTDQTGLLKQMTDNPAPEGGVVFDVAPTTFAMKVGGPSRGGTVSDVKSAPDRVDFTVTINGDAKQIRIERFRDAMILMTNTDATPPVTLVLRKQAAAQTPDGLAKSLIGTWDLTKLVMNKGTVELPPEPSSLSLAADKSYRGKLGPGPVESGTWSIEEDNLLRLKSAEGPLEGKVTVAGEAMTLEVEGTVYHYRRGKSP